MLVGVDIGGTFTDVVLFDSNSGKLFKEKVSSTPKNYSECFINAIEQVKNNIDDIGKEKKGLIEYIGHGSTVSTNAVVSRTGSKMALITTKGFKDVLIIGKTKRENIYDLFYKKPVPLIPRSLIFEVDERISSDGKVETKLNKHELKKIIEQIPKDIECVCIVFFNSYANHIHEKKAEEIIKTERADLVISSSYKIHSIYREYNRTSTTVLNGYVAPPTIRYLNEIKKLTEKKYPLPFIVTGNGGMSTMKDVREIPATTFLSGPAAGVSGATHLGKLIGKKNIITFDMGGTSCDVALIDEGNPVKTMETEIEGYPLFIPTISINTIASGGGSIGWVDKGKVLHIGPMSAGSEPGPVCYDRGGEEPTVTDANVVLNRYPEVILGGKMKFNKKNAEEAIYNKIAKPLGLDIITAAEGMLKIVNEKMVDAIRLVSIQKGYNPSDFNLIAIGGAGPSHISFMLDELRIPSAICSPYSSVFCALGILLTPLRKESVVTEIIKNPLKQRGEIVDIFKRLKIENDKKNISWDYIQKTASYEMSIDVRYRGQKFETNTPVYERDLKQEDITSIINRFHKIHKTKYSYCQLEHEVEFVNFHLVSITKMYDIKLKEIEEGISLDEIKKGEREVIFDKEYVMTPIYHGEKVKSNHQFRGPSIIEYYDTTIVIPPNKDARADKYGNIIISRRLL